ncbi:hypothetical protein TRIUR3_34529 [Triticum urartu]|uniref:Methyltransferase type 12 domain-containing protein n=1 Tax=Triticum urartu TaxID=4572 RepID=M7YP53_TRIUA|nr:hypothetical protein TRIUR3_34529 [Triticum urartu]
MAPSLEQRRRRVTTTTTTAAPAPIATFPDDVAWLKAQLASNSLALLASADAWHELRKGINPRTRERQLFDLNRHHGISHYPEEEATNHTALPCPGELLVEEHHSNYGEPWAGGRDVFEFLANASALAPRDQVLEIGCGTLRVGLHFIRFLDAGRFHCLEQDELSLMAALRYELPSQGLLYKRPMIVRGGDMDFSKFGDTVMYDLIYSSAAFLHIPRDLVWTGLERLAGKLRPKTGRIFVSHNIKFCTSSELKNVHKIDDGKPNSFLQPSSGNCHVRDLLVSHHQPPSYCEPENGFLGSKRIHQVKLV